MSVPDNAVRAPSTTSSNNNSPLLTAVNSFSSTPNDTPITSSPYKDASAPPPSPGICEVSDPPPSTPLLREDHYADVPLRPTLKSPLQQDDVFPVLPPSCADSFIQPQSCTKPSYDERCSSQVDALLKVLPIGLFLVQLLTLFILSAQISASDLVWSASLVLLFGFMLTFVLYITLALLIPLIRNSAQAQYETRTVASPPREAADPQHRRAAAVTSPRNSHKRRPGVAERQHVHHKSQLVEGRREVNESQPVADTSPPLAIRGKPVNPHPSVVAATYTPISHESPVIAKVRQAVADTNQPLHEAVKSEPVDPYPSIVAAARPPISHASQTVVKESHPATDRSQGAGIESKPVDPYPGVVASASPPYHRGSEAIVEKSQPVDPYPEIVRDGRCRLDPYPILDNTAHRPFSPYRDVNADAHRADTRRCIPIWPRITSSRALRQCCRSISSKINRRSQSNSAGLGKENVVGDDWSCSASLGANSVEDCERRERKRSRRECGGCRKRGVVL